MKKVASPLLLTLAAALLLFVLAGPAAAYPVWVPIGNPGNAADTTSNCVGANCGSVSYSYSISRTEITNSQYTAFLRRVAKTDTHGLYSTEMAGPYGGIIQSGTSGSYGYSTKSGYSSKAVNFVSFYDALRYANWLHNGKPTGAQDASTTEDGAYTITPLGIANNSITRNLGATIFLPNENEWYKAAFYSPGGVYFDYPTGTDTQTVCATPTPLENHANCDFAVGAPTMVMAYRESESPYGTYDQGGNVWEMNETVLNTSYRDVRGGGMFEVATEMAGAGPHFIVDPSLGEYSWLGFRVATSLIVDAPVVPIGGVVGPILAGLLVATGLMAHPLRRRERPGL